MTYDELIETFKEQKFCNVSDIEEFFVEFGFSGDIETCQWDNLTITFTSLETDAYFNIVVDPYDLTFRVIIYKNEEDYEGYLIDYKMVLLPLTFE